MLPRLKVAANLRHVNAQNSSQSIKSECKILILQNVSTVADSKDGSDRRLGVRQSEDNFLYSWRAHRPPTRHTDHDN